MNIGYCIINEKFDIEFSNKFFKNNFSHLTKPEEKKSPFILEKKTTLFSYAKLISSISAKINVLDVNQTDNNETHANLNQNSKTLNLLNNENLKLDCEDLILDEEEEDYLDSKPIIKPNFREIFLNFVIKKSVLNDPSYTVQNKFKIKNKKDIYEIHIRSNEIYEDTYELIFKNVTNNFNIENLNLEKKYKNILLAKISHEFKAPIMYIQNIVDNVLDFEKYNDLSESSRKEKFNLNSDKNEEFIKIKYLTEILLILILDLSEYVNHENKNENLISSNNLITGRKYNNNQSILEFNSLKEYLKNISSSFMLIYNKKLSIKIIYDVCLENAKFTIDERRIKQILANLLSNSIKNTIEGEIKIIINLNEDAGSINTSGKRTSFKENEVITFNEGFNIIIEDSGPGIEEDIMNTINYEPDALLSNIKKTFAIGFIDNKKTKNEYQTTKGLGIGLQICKKLCHELDIKITCELIKENLNVDTNSDRLVNTGTKFTLSLFNQLDMSANNCSLTRITLLNEIILNQDEKILLKYDNKSLWEDINNDIIDIIDKNEDIKLINPINNNNLYNNKMIMMQVCSFQIKGYSDSHSHLSSFRPPCINQYNTTGHEEINLRSYATNRTSFSNLLKSPQGKFLHPNYSSSFISNKGSKKNLFKPFKNRLSQNFNKIGNLAVLRNVKTFNNNNNINKINQENYSISIEDVDSTFKKDKEIYIKPIIIEKDIDYVENELNSNIILPMKTYLDNNHDIIYSEDSRIERFDSQKFLFSLNDDIKTLNKISFKSSKPKWKPFNKVSKKFSVENVNDFSDYSSAISESFNLNSTSVNDNKILIIDDNKNNQDAIEKLVKRYFAKKHKKSQLSNFSPNIEKDRLSTNYLLKEKKSPIIKKLSDGIELVYEIYNEVISFGKNVTKIIFCDEMMVYMNGSEAFTIINKILTDKGINKIPFVICSAFTQESHFEKMKSLSIEHVYEKPLSFGNVEFILDNIMK